MAFLNNLNRAATAKCRFLFICGAVSTAVLLGAALWPYTIDDAYIVLRYARNIVAGGGYGFNFGEPVEGVTSLVWTALALPGEALGLEGPEPIKAFGLLCAVLAVLGLARVLEAEGETPAVVLLAPFVLATQLTWVVWGVAGLETALAGLLALFGVVLSTRESGRDRVWGSIVLGVAFLARPDLAVLWIVIVVFPLFRWRWQGVAPARRDLVPLLVVLVSLIGVSLIRHQVFDSFVPNTALVKTGTPLAASFAAGVPIFGSWLLFQGTLSLVGLATVGGMRRDARSAARLLALVAFYGYVVGLGNPDMGLVYRFYAPAIPLLVLVAASGASRVARILGNRGLALGMVLLLIPIGLAPTASIKTWRSPQHVFGTMSSLSEVADSTAVSRDFALEMRDSLDQDALIAISDAGTIPYYAEHRMVDLYGLNDAELGRAIHDFKVASNQRQREEASRRYLESVMGRKPDAFVQTGIPPVIMNDPRFQQCYREAEMSREYWFNRRIKARYVLYLRICD